MNTPKIVNAQDAQSIQKAVELLRQGCLVAFPTETVYGLGADAFDEKAVLRIFEAKKRPSFDPLIVHVCSIEQACTLWQETPKNALALMKAFWPGPFTLVLPKSSLVPDVVTAGLSTVAVRMPNNEQALALIRALGHPIAAPSANVFGYTSPTSALHVFEGLGESVDLVLDGGDTVIGVESTVVKLTSEGCQLLRLGAVTPEQIEKIVPVHPAPSASQEAARRGGVESPGQLESHYAPWTPMFLLAKPFVECAKQAEEIFKEFQEKKKTAPRVGLLAFRSAPAEATFESVQVLSAEGDLHEAAAKLFQAVRKLDKMNLDFIFAEPVPEKGIGLAIMDRLRKACKKGFQC